MGIGENRLLNPSALPVLGHEVGVLHIASRYPVVRGHLQNARSLDIPLAFECVTGITPEQIVRCDPAVDRPLLDATGRLRDRGVKAIVGTCGSFINFQSMLTDEFDIPIFSSIMLMAPVLLKAVNKSRQVLVIFASATSYTERVRHEAGIDEPERLVVTDCLRLPAFAPIMGNENWLDSQALEEQLMAQVAADIERTKTISAILLQCSELAPYADQLRARFGMPVIEVTSFARWVDRTVGADY